MVNQSQFIEGYYNRYEPTNLGDHISVIRGVSYKPDDIRETGDEAVAILRSNNISDGEINFEDLVYVSPTCVSEKQFVDAGDIVMCGSNGSKKLVGKAGLIAEKQSRTSFGAFCLGIRCKKTLAPEYLNAFFNSQMYRDIIEELGNGTNIINIRPDHITSLSIPIPEKNVQNEFVELTRQADKSKFAGFKSQFIEMTKATKSIKLEDVAKEIFAGGDKPKDYRSVQNGQYQYPVFSNGIGDNALLCFSKECRVKESAITVSARGTIGHAESREAGFTPVVRLLTLIPKDGYQLAYLKFALNNITFHSTGSSQGQLTAPDFSKYEIPDAPKDVQLAFESIVHHADKSKYLN